MGLGGCKALPGTQRGIGLRGGVPLQAKLVRTKLLKVGENNSITRGEADHSTPSAALAPRDDGATAFCRVQGKCRATLALRNIYREILDERCMKPFQAAFEVRPCAAQVWHRMAACQTRLVACLVSTLVCKQAVGEQQVDGDVR